MVSYIFGFTTWKQELKPVRIRRLWDDGWRWSWQIDWFLSFRCAARDHHNFPSLGMPYVFTRSIESRLVGGLVAINFEFSHMNWEFHHPNGRTHIFQRGGPTTNQESIVQIIPNKNGWNVYTYWLEQCPSSWQPIFLYLPAPSGPNTEPAKKMDEWSQRVKIDYSHGLCQLSWIINMGIVNKLTKLTMENWAFPWLYPLTKLNLLEGNQ